MSKKVCFASSSGGHLEQLLMLEPLMEKYDSFIVTEKTSYDIKFDRKTYLLHQVNRKEVFFPVLLFVNFLKSIVIYIKERPAYIVTTGVLSIIPLALIVKCFGGKLIFIESFAKVTTPTITGKFLYKYADQFYVQWKTMKEVYPNAIYVGGIY